MKTKLFDDIDFYKKLWIIALPIAVQNLISSLLNMIDTMMITNLGEIEVAAVGFANQLFFIFMLFMFGINSGAAIFVSQFWGKKDKKNIRRVLGVSVFSGIIVAVIFTLVAIVFPEFVMKIFSKDPKVIEAGVSYLGIIGFSYIITAVSFSYSFACRSIGQAKLPMFVSFIALGTNTILNYGLILGNFGLPRLGVKGAAIATLIARSIEIILMLSIIYKNKGPLAAKISEMTDVSKKFFKKVSVTAAPVVANELLWAVGMSCYMIAYGKVGTNAAASVHIANTIQNLFMVINMGLANASAIMIGNEIGRKKTEKAFDYANKFSILGPLSGIIVGLGLYFIAPHIVSFMNIKPESINDTIRILAVIALYQPIKTFNVIMVVGILRSGGDTLYSFILEIGSVWLIGVPMAFLGAVVFKVPIYYVVAMASVEEIFKFIIGAPRVISKKWLNNVVENL